MKVGVCIKFRNSYVFPKPFRHLYEEHIEYARAADALGFDYIVVPEHHSIEIGCNPAPFVTLAALARETKRIGLTTQPLLLPLYNPVWVAEQVAVLDVISNGRALLGLGVGYLDSDFRSYGIPKRERGARMDEAVEIVLGTLRERNFNYHGKFYQVSGVDIAPRPLQQPHPKVFLTTGSPKAVDRAVRHGLPVNMIYNEAISQGLYAYYCQQIVASGRDPSSVDISVASHGFVAKDADTALRMSKPYLQAFFEGWLRQRPHPMLEGAVPEEMISSGASGSARNRARKFGLVIGAPQTWLDTLQADLQALNGPVPVSGLTFTLWPEAMPLKDALQALDIFAQEVLPWLHSTEAGGLSKKQKSTPRA
ncbi:MAG: LLM class flavin-dependent oxidoreductase [Chloroflexi bacterium]|nr:LLM class flavin-dependent oxidoreductase [Chloroflexota bacterium]